MKLTALLLTIACLQVAARGDGQTVTLKVADAPMKEVFFAIQQQTRLNVMIDQALLEKTGRVTLDVRNMPVQELLNLCLKNEPLSYTIVEGRIVIRAKPGADVTTIIVNEPPPIDVKGRVVNENGEGVVATVTVKGTRNAVTTDVNGYFEMKGVTENAILVITGIAVETLEIRVAGKADLRNVSVKTKVTEGESVLVEVNTGYQRIPKERATGSFTTVNNATINRSVSTNILDRLEGVASGITFNKTVATNRSNLTVRGISTINANSKPLIVIDGMPYEEPIYGSTTNLNINNVNLLNLNPNDVESITILKDAAAASVWGARSGNGVIVITTKKGRYNQKANIRFNSNVTVGEEPDIDYFPTIPSTDIVDLEKMLFARGVYDSRLNNTTTFPAVSQGIEILAKRRAGIISAADSAQQLLALKGNDIRSDIKKYLLRKSVNQQYALNFSGGSSLYNYYASVGYDRNISNAVRDDYSRLTLRFENSYRPFKQIELNGYVNYSQNKSNNNGLGYSGLLSNGTTGGAPYVRIADDNGVALAIPNGYRTVYIDTARYPALLDWRYRPLDELSYNNNTVSRYTVRMGAGVKYNIISSLNAELKYQYEKTTGSSSSEYNKQSFFVRDLVNRYMSISRNDGRTIIYPIPNAAILDRGNSELSSWNLRGQLNFSQVWGEHSFTAIAGAEARRISGISGMARYYGYDQENGTINPQINFDSLYRLRPGSSTARVPNPSKPGAWTENRYLSYYSNAGYSYKQRYDLSASVRADGTNYFGVKANQRIVPLWSAGAAWNISREKFYRITWLPYLKTRVTYGYNGNMYNSASAYPTIQYANPTSSSLIPIQYATIQSPGNPELTWEKVRIVNLAVDFALKGDRVSGSLEYYKKKGIGLIGALPINATTGIQSYIGNGATLAVNGIDLTINTENTTGPLKWQTTFLLSFNKDKVVAYDNTGLNSGDMIRGSIPVIGKPLYSIFSYKWAGLSSGGDPRAFIADTVAAFSVVGANAKPQDLVYSGPLNPIYFGSIMNTFSWRSLSLSFNIVYKLKYVFRRTSINYSNLFNLSQGHNDYLLRWTKPGDEAMTNVPAIPITSNATRDDVYANSNILVEKGDHIRLQDIRLSYSFNKAQFTKLPFQNAQLYMYASNLGILWRANKGHIDPDYGSTLIPASRSISVGLNISL